jgi:hypothetical protein
MEVRESNGGRKRKLSAEESHHGGKSDWDKAESYSGNDTVPQNSSSK